MDLTSTAAATATLDPRDVAILEEASLVQGTGYEHRMAKVDFWNDIQLGWNKYAQVRTIAKKKEQEKRIRELRISQGEDPDTYIWNDLDTTFRYTPFDIPVATGFSLGEELDVRISRYRALDKWIGEVFSSDVTIVMRYMHIALKEYCESDAQPADDPHPKCRIGQLCFVKVPSYAEIDEMMERAVGKKEWARQRRPEMRIPGDDQLAGTWVRAECNYTSSCRKYAQFTSIDTGRAFPAAWTNARRAVWRFLVYPGTAFACILLLSNPIQVTVEVHKKWYSIMKRGTHMTFQLVGQTPTDELLLRLAHPTEDDLDQQYKTSLNGKPDPADDFENSPLYTTPENVLMRQGLFF